MRAGCGCAQLDELDEDPGIDRAEREARTLAAHEAQRAWGCTAAGLEPPATLTRGQREDVEDWQRITRCGPTRTCPFAATRRPSPWHIEVVRAVRIMERTNGGMTFREITGRAPHVWDVRAIAALLETGDAVSVSDDKVRERERATRDAEQAARGEAGRR